MILRNLSSPHSFLAMRFFSDQQKQCENTCHSNFKCLSSTKLYINDPRLNVVLEWRTLSRKTNAVENINGYLVRKSHLYHLQKPIVFIFIFNQSQANIFERTNFPFHSQQVLCIHACLPAGLDVIQLNSMGLWLEMESDWQQSIYWMPTQGKWFKKKSTSSPHAMPPKTRQGIIVEHMQYRCSKKHRERLWRINSTFMSYILVLFCGLSLDASHSQELVCSPGDSAARVGNPALKPSSALHFSNKLPTHFLFSVICATCISFTFLVLLPGLEN